MRKPTIGLCMIAKNEEGKIGKAIESTVDFMDAVFLLDTGSTDKTIEEAKEVCKKHNKTLVVKEINPESTPEAYMMNTSREYWEETKQFLDTSLQTYEAWCEFIKQRTEPIFDFAVARNINFNMATTDYIFWIDCDDTVENPESIPALLENSEMRGITGIAMTYLYDIEEETGKVRAEHPKLRIVKNGSYKWTEKAPIHENLFPVKGVQPLEAMDTKVMVKHGKKNWDSAMKRNMKVLKEMERREGDHPDPRTIFLLARETFGGKADSDEGLEYAKKYLATVPSGGERMQVCNLICEYYQSRFMYDKQLNYGYLAIKSFPQRPQPYVMVAKAYSNIGDYENVLEFCKIALQKDTSRLDAIVQSEADLERQLSLLMAEAYGELEQSEMAVKVLEKYLSSASKNEVETFSRDLHMLQGKAQMEEVNKSFHRLANLLLSQNKIHLIRSFLEVLPEEMKDSSVAIKLKRAVGLRKEWQDNEICIFAGGIEIWDQETVFTKGAGGSETAIAEMAMRWGKMGWKVTVYNTVEEKKCYGNVTYLPNELCNWADKFNIFISWRMPGVFKEYEIDAKKRYLWLHDVPVPQQFNLKIINSVDKIMVLSKFHRTFLPNVPEEKFYYTGNGINVELIEEIEKENIERDPYRIIYCSSPDRGLDRAIDIFEEAKKNEPKLSMVFAYGWNNFDKVRKDRKSFEWKHKLLDRMEKLGIKDLGRLNKKDLLREMFKSQIWLYPTSFDEINCIVAQETQACGVTPLTTGHGALVEVQLGGVMANKDVKGMEFELRMLMNDLLKKTPEEIRVREEELNRIKEQMKRESFVIGNEKNEEKKEIRKENFEELYKKRLDLKADIEEAKVEPIYSEARRKFSWQTRAEEWSNDLFGGQPTISNPLVTVFCPTIRPGIFRILREQLEKQTYTNLELVVVDGRYEERKEEVKEYMKDFKFPFLHLPDPDRDKTRYPYGLYRADNAGIWASRGELFVWLDDFITIEEDGIEKFVNLYRKHPELIYAGVDTRNAYSCEKFELMDKIDVYKGGSYTVKEVQFTSPRIKIGGAERVTTNPLEFEMNWAAAPTKILKDMGGYDEEWDKGFGYDNSSFGLRFLYLGGRIIIQEHNIATCLSHWDMSPKDEVGVPDRDKKPNDNRYKSLFTHLSETPDANVILELKQPNYPDNILKLVEEWKQSEVS